MADAVRTWHPDVPGVREVLHATFEQHAYPAHIHDDWTVLLIDDGAVEYSLGRTRHHATPAQLTILPPDVPHDGRSATSGRSFRKRVLYLDRDWLPAHAADVVAIDPTLPDPRGAVLAAAIHTSLADPTDVLAAEHGVLELRRAVQAHVGPDRPDHTDVPLARRLRGLLDDRLTESVTLAEAGRVLSAHPAHLARCFRQAYGIAPHQYVVGRRVDLARRLVAAGHSPADVAARAGFHDQAHLTRHFRRVLGATPRTFAA